MNRTLYYSPGSCALAPHIVLEEIGAPYALKLVSTGAGETRTPEFRRFNPKARVPVLLEDGVKYTESPAILLHLAYAHPELNLAPVSNEDPTRTHEWFNWLSGTVHSVAIRQIWRPDYFTTQPEQHEGIKAKGCEHLLEAFSLIEGRMSSCTWAVGDRYSTVDLYLLVIYRWGNRMGHDMRNDYAAWTQHTLRLLERPAVERALAQEGISMWR